MQRIALGADHGGFELKQVVAAHLAGRGIQVEDCGTHGKDPVDYPTIAAEVAGRVADGRCQLGIMIDGAGIGSAMVANKIAGVRAALCYDVSSARNSREHNNANLLTLGASLIGAGLAVQIVDTFVDSQCTVERHLRRVAMIDQIDRGASHPGAECGCGSKPCSCSDRGASQAEDALADLSEQDLKRVAERIAQMLQGGQAPGTPELCAEAACGFCRSCAEINPQAVREMIGLGADRIVHRGDGQAVPADVAGYIDHTLLRPDATFDQITKLCQEAAQFHFASVCINPFFVKHCAEILRGSSAKVCTVVGFPLGANTTETKALEARRAIRDGAREIDMVINVGALKSGRDDQVYRDIRAVVEACIDGGAICKVILETALLNDDEKVRACRAARRAQADFVKTSTGFGPGGATADDVALMAREVAGTRMGVKASGGIRNYEQAQQMIRAGATRLGASAGVRIVKESQGVTISDATGDKY